jgi:carboxyl-terminal processing protease
MNSRFKFVVVTSSTCLVVLLLLGAVMAKSSPAGEPYRHLQVFSEVISRIKADYVEEPDMKNVTLGAVNGLLESLDPYASYLNPEQYKQYQKKDHNKGSVGLLLSRRFGYVGVIDSIEGSPADKAGLGTGDMLETIGGVSTRDMPLAYAQLLLQGEPGTSVELTVLRVRKPEPQPIKLTRTVLKFQPVTAKMLENGIGVVKAESLEAGKTKEIAEAVNGLKKQGLKKLVLDLRHNAFGTAEEGIKLADLFMDSGVITYAEGQTVAKQVSEAHSEDTIYKDKLVVITNRGTGEGAEIAAAALQDAKRAEVVGERTYGDAAIRKAVSTEDGGALIISVAKYYSPSGKALQDVAVTPNQPVVEQEQPTDVEDDEDGQAAPAPATTPEPRKTPGEDLLLRRAIEVLNGTVSQVANTKSAPALAPPGQPMAPLNIPQKQQ